MKILAIDDEKPALGELVYHIRNVLPDAAVDSFTSSEEAVKAAKAQKYDVAFSDIQMPVLQGVELAKALKETNPQINIIFVTGYSEYKDDAIRLHASGYVEKPVSDDDIREQMENLLHPPKEGKRIYAQTFGNFCLFADGKPVHFHRDREMEMLAYLIDRRGAAISRKEIAAVLFEESDFSRTEQIYLSAIAHDLAEDLAAVGAEKMFRKERGVYSVDTEQFSCDSYEFLKSGAAAGLQFGGEYMEQYSWAEYLKGKFGKNGFI